jgi:APA family basic amino acid/polyamine antiporter
MPRATLMSAVVVAIMALNIRGIKQSSLAVNILTIGKLTPLVIFILVGLPQISVEAIQLGAFPSLEQLSAAALPLIFAFGGYEVVPVPAGEARDPKKAVPFAMIATIIIVAILMTLAQIVALGTLPGLATTRTPLADASLLLMGAWGALMMTVGTSISMAGNNVGAALSGSRSLFALAEQHDVPRMFSRIHPTFRTPDVAIAFTCLSTLALALSGSFATLAAVSAVARLVIYSGTCASVLVLRRQGRAPFTIPGGPIVPALALVVCVTILYGATSAQLQAGGQALLAGALLFLIARLGAKGKGK